LLAGASLGLVGAGLGLTGCAETPTGGQPATGAGGSAARPPAYVPFTGVKADLPGTAEGVSPAFLSYPSPPLAREGFPLPATEPFTALLQGAPAATAPDRNDAYRVLRDQAGNSMNALTVISSQYLDKFQVTMASNDIPDFVQIMKVPQYPTMLEKYFTDLSDVLGGDGVKKYPALANIPTETWKIPTVNGRLWGFAQPRPPAGRILSTRGDLLTARGLDASPAPANGAEFVELLKALTDRGKNQFALGGDPTDWLLPGVLEMMEAPNGWALQDGTFVSQLASEQMVEALNECGKIIRAGYQHPNSFSDPGQNGVWWTAGTTSMLFQAFTGWGTYARSQPSWQVGHVTLPKWNGGGTAPLHKSVAGYDAFVSIRKQASDQRLDELLRIVDLIASPFGTQQFLDVNYGAPGFTYDMVDGNPQFTKDGSTNVVKGWPYAGGNSQAVLFTPGQDELTRAQHAYLSEQLPNGVADASQGLYSETEVTKGATQAKAAKDVQRAVLLGEQPISAWQDFVKKWSAEVGDRIAGEFADAAAQ